MLGHVYAAEGLEAGEQNAGQPWHPSPARCTKGPGDKARG
jgi:hypothetical protein